MNNASAVGGYIVPVEDYPQGNSFLWHGVPLGDVGQLMKPDMHHTRSVPMGLSSFCSH